MPRRSSYIEETPEHIHEWISGYNSSEMYCRAAECHYIAVSPLELELRKQEWNSYYQLVITTDSYLDFKIMKQAVKAKNYKVILELMERARQRLESGESLPKPKFYDPDTSRNYVVLG